MYNPIASEFRYYQEITSELVNEKLAITVEQVCRCAAAGDEEALNLLASKAEHLVGRVSRATSRTEDELAAEFKQVVELHQSGKAALAVQSYTNDHFPRRLIAVADLKFRLLQCTTSLKHRLIIPKFGAKKLFLSQQRRQEREAGVSNIDVDGDGDGDDASAAEPHFLQQCAVAAEAALVDLLSTGRHQEALNVLVHALGNPSDIHELTFRSLLVESFQIVVGHVDDGGRVKRAGSLAPSSPPSPASSSSNLPTPTAAPASAPSSPSEPSQQLPRLPPPIDPNRPSAEPVEDAAAAAASAHVVTKPPRPPFPVPAAAAESESPHPALPVYSDDLSEEQILQMLRNFYATYVPDYAASVPYLVEQHRGKYPQLFDLIREKYAATVIAKHSSASSAGGGGGGGSASSSAMAADAPLKQDPTGGEKEAGPCALQ